MKRFILAALFAALIAPESEACLAGRRAARVRTVRTVTTSRTSERVVGREAVRSIVAVPVRVVGRVLEAFPCPNCR